MLLSTKIILTSPRTRCGLFPHPTYLVQPLNRDTGPGLIFALLTLECVYGDAIVAVFPTDHLRR